MNEFVFYEREKKTTVKKKEMCTMPKMDRASSYLFSCLNRIYLLIIDCLRLYSTQIEHEYKALQLCTTTKNHWVKSLSRERLIHLVYRVCSSWCSIAHTHKRNFSFFFHWNESLWPRCHRRFCCCFCHCNRQQNEEKKTEKLFFNKFFLFRWLQSIVFT